MLSPVIIPHPTFQYFAAAKFTRFYVIPLYIMEHFMIMLSNYFTNHVQHMTINRFPITYYLIRNWFVGSLFTLSGPSI